MRRPSLQAAVTAAVVVGAAVFILLQLQPGLLLATTTPSGGDMGAHVWGPAYLRDHVLPHGRITGWTPDWYAGFPAFHYYFPLPSLLIVLLDLVLPYGVAFKLVTVLGLVTLPAAAATLGRALRLPFPTAPLMAAGTIFFVFDRFHTIWGGNAAATLAGEFAFSIGLSTALFFLAALSRALETGRGRVLAGVLLAVTALCHLLPAAFAVMAAGVLLLVRRPDRARWGIVIVAGTLGLALAAFWFVPFMARLPYSNDMGWERTYGYVENLLPFLRDDDGAAPATTSHLRMVLPLAAAGAFVGTLRRRRGVIVLAVIALAMAAGFRFVPEGPIWNARLLPFWYLSVYFLAAVAIAEASLMLQALSSPSRDGAREGSGAFPVGGAIAGLMAVLVAAAIPLGAFSTGRLSLPGSASLPFPKVSSSDTSFIPAWARWNYSGYEGKPDYPDFRHVVTTMEDVGRTVGCGRAMWEYEPELNRYGTPMALMLLPYFTDGCIGSMEGLFFESSATVPYHFLNQSELSRNPSRAMRDLPYRALDVDTGVDHLRLLGVRYFMAINPETQAQAALDPDLRLLTSTNPHPVDYAGRTEQRSWQIYEVEDTALVAPLEYEPVVVDSPRLSSWSGRKEAWLEAAVDWYQQPSRWDIPLADDGPTSWERIPSPDRTPPPTAVRPANVSRIRSDDDGVSFDVDRTGVPVVVRTSYFPNWKASGADGPWRITPNLMVVVPTARHVELRYGWTPVDVVAWATTLLGIAAAVLLARRGRVRLPEPPPPPEEYVDPFVQMRENAGDDDAPDRVLAGTSPARPAP